MLTSVACRSGQGRTTQARTRRACEVGLRAVAPQQHARPAGVPLHWDRGPGEAHLRLLREEERRERLLV
eukprot:scaffold789_cov125-Isochrysis_galbana.AAC.11